MAIKLKRCPFCGGKKTLQIVIYPKNGITRFSDKYAVQCTYTGERYGCGAEGQRNKIKEFAIAAWNRRHGTKGL